MSASQLEQNSPRMRASYRSRWEYVGWAVVVPVGGLLLLSAAINPNFHWDVVATYLTAPVILEGAWMTLLLTAVSMLLGVVLGTALAVMTRSGSTLLSRLAQAYVWFFRATPLLVQLIFWFNLAALYPTLGFPGFEFNATKLITPLTAALLGLSTNEAAYMAEIIRGGFESINSGQTEAARSLALRPRHVTFRILLPQALKVVVPIIGNQTIAMLKNSSLVSVLGVSELLYSAELVYGTNYQTIPLLIVACIWYLGMSTILSLLQYVIERRLSASNRRVAAPLHSGADLASPIAGAGK